MLTVTDLYKRFGDKEVLKGVSLQVPQGSIFGFIGRNGAGKTTTMKAVLGLLQPDRGEILVSGEHVRYGETPTNRHIGYLPDVPEFYGFLTAKEYLRLCADIRGTDPKQIPELLDLVGLGSEKHRIRGWSRGMKQRLGIAQALLNRPKLLICDEPTSALDPVGRKEILDILLAARQQTTILFSTHILSDVERICTDVAFLDNGVVEIHGKVSEIKSKFRSDEYLLEVEGEQALTFLKTAFPKMALSENRQLEFRQQDHDAHEVLRFIADNRLPLVRFEQVEPTLETLFMEVTGERNAFSPF